MAIRDMHAMSVISTHLFTTEVSSFSKLIAERWVANKGVTATLGKWWVMPLYRDNWENSDYKNQVNPLPPYETNFEGWEAGHSKKDCGASNQTRAEN